MRGLTKDNNRTKPLLTVQCPGASWGQDASIHNLIVLGIVESRQQNLHGTQRRSLGQARYNSKVKTWERGMPRVGKMPGAGDGRCHSVPEEQQEVCEDQDGPTNRTVFK